MNFGYSIYKKQFINNNSLKFCKKINHILINTYSSRNRQLERIFKDSFFLFKEVRIRVTFLFIFRSTSDVRFVLARKTKEPCCPIQTYINIFLLYMKRNV